MSSFIEIHAVYIRSPVDWIRVRGPAVDGAFVCPVSGSMTDNGKIWSIDEIDEDGQMSFIGWDGCYYTNLHRKTLKVGETFVVYETPRDINRDPWIYRIVQVQPFNTPPQKSIDLPGVTG